MAVMIISAILETSTNRHASHNLLWLKLYYFCKLRLIPVRLKKRSMPMNAMPSMHQAGVSTLFGPSHIAQNISCHTSSPARRTRLPLCVSLTNGWLQDTMQKCWTLNI